MTRTGLTLMELMIVVIVVGILAAIALPNFTPMREKTIEKEAQASLRLMQAAQKIYRMEMGQYYPMNAGTAPIEITNHAQINADLKLMLPMTGPANVFWSYRARRGGCDRADRINPPPNAFWTLQMNQADPVSNAACP